MRGETVVVDFVKDFGRDGGVFVVAKNVVVLAVERFWFAGKEVEYHGVVLVSLSICSGENDSVVERDVFVEQVSEI
jgi:hypothetical protein